MKDVIGHTYFSTVVKHVISRTVSQARQIPVVIFPPNKVLSFAFVCGCEVRMLARRQLQLGSPGLPLSLSLSPPSFFMSFTHLSHSLRMLTYSMRNCKWRGHWPAREALISSIGKWHGLSVL